VRVLLFSNQGNAIAKGKSTMTYTNGKDDNNTASGTAESINDTAATSAADAAKLVWQSHVICLLHACVCKELTHYYMSKKTLYEITLLIFTTNELHVVLYLIVIATCLCVIRLQL
jgi:hypothetical protein